MHYYTRLCEILQAARDTQWLVQADLRDNDVPFNDSQSIRVTVPLQIAIEQLRVACTNAFALASAAPHICGPEHVNTLVNDDIEQCEKLLDHKSEAF